MYKPFPVNQRARARSAFINPSTARILPFLLSPRSSVPKLFHGLIRFRTADDRSLNGASRKSVCSRADVITYARTESETMKTRICMKRRLTTLASYLDIDSRRLTRGN